MAQNVVINGVTYSNVPMVKIPLTDSGNAEFYDTSDATLSSGDYMLESYTAYADGTKYTGTIVSKNGGDLSASGDTVTVPAGYYSSQATKAVAAGTVTAPSTISGSSATISTSSNTLTLTKTVSVTPTVSTAGYVSSGTAGNASVTLSASATIKGATTYTPGTSDQTIASGTYTTGAQTIKGDANLLASNIKSGVTIFNVQGSLTSATVSQDGTTKVLTIS